MITITIVYTFQGRETHRMKATCADYAAARRIAADYAKSGEDWHFADTCGFPA